MLKALRNKSTQKKIYIVVAVAVVATFVISGVVLTDFGQNPSTLGKIAGKNVSLQEYMSGYKATLHQAAWAYGSRFDEVKNYINFKGETWDRLLWLNEAKKQKIRISDKEVVEWVTQQAVFAKSGKFDAQIYNNFTTIFLRTSSREFEEEVRDLLKIRKLWTDISSKISVSDEELKRLYDQQNGERGLAYTVIPWEKEAEQVTVDPKELEPIYPALKDTLTEPTKVKVSYLFVPKERQEESKALFAETGRTLEELSSKYGVPVKTTPLFPKNEGTPELASKEMVDLAFNQPVLKESDWAYVDAGAYKIRVDLKQDERPLSFEEAKDEILNIVKKQKAIEEAVKKLNAIRLKSPDFETAMKDAGLEIKTLDPYKKGAYLPGVGPSQSFEEKISALKQGEATEAIAVPAGATVIKVVKDLAADEKKFAEEKDTFRQRIVEQKAEAQRNDYLEKLRNKLAVNLETMKKLFPEDPNARP